MRNCIVLQILVLLILLFSIFSIGCQSTSEIPPPQVNTATLPQGIFYKLSSQATSVIDPQTKSNEILTEQQEDLLSAKLSPDNLKIICCQQIGFEPYETTLADNQKNITLINETPWEDNTFQAYTAVWSASGRKILVAVTLITDTAAERFGRYALYSLDTESLDFSFIEDGLLSAFAVSPTKDEIVIVKVQNEQGGDTKEAGGYLVNLTDNTREQIFDVPYAYTIQHITFSPDGRRLAVVWSEGTPSGVDIINLETKETRTIVDTAPNLLQWSPDGQWIAGIATFLGDNAAGRLVVQSIDDDQQIVFGSFISDITWSPDSTKLAFVQQGGDIKVLSTLSINNRDVEEIIRDPEYIDIQAWR